MNKKQKEPKNKTLKIENSDIAPISRARAYGVTKKETIFTRINEYLADIMFFVLMTLSMAIIVIGALGMVYMLQEIGIALCIIIAIAFVYIVVLRTVRKRLSFYSKLKKLCKKNKIRIKFHRSFFRSLKNNDSGNDLTVETGTAVWNVRFFTVRKYNSAIVFLGSDTLQITSPRPKGRVPAAKHTPCNEKVKIVTRDRAALGFRYMTTTLIPISFPQITSEINNKTIRNVLLINPVSHSIYKKLSDGTVVPTGSGEKMDNYTIYTASGFTEMLTRESDTPTRSVIH